MNNKETQTLDRNEVFRLTVQTDSILEASQLRCWETNSKKSKPKIQYYYLKSDYFMDTCFLYLLDKEEHLVFTEIFGPERKKKQLQKFNISRECTHKTYLLLTCERIYC